jgi:thiol-disulfide isomerase/thioredoxin
MGKNFLWVSLMSGVLAAATAQDSPQKGEPAANRGKNSRRQDDGASPEALARLTELEKKLEGNTGDKVLVRTYAQSLRSYVNSAARSAQRAAGREPAEAVKRFRLAQSALSRIPEGIDDQEAGREFERLRKTVADAEEKLARILKHDELIGKKAAPLKVEQWVNGTPLSDSDLKGKVVLLDFCAVWCRPSIETFPEFAKWREKYADKGLVIVGLTKYYNYQWDERTEGPREAPSGEVPRETEREMLQKFAARHELKHSIGTQADAELADFYGVTAVPQLVLVDREGVIRLIRAGGQAENLPEIAATLEKLLGDAKAGEAVSSAPGTGDAPPPP